MQTAAAQQQAIQAQTVGQQQQNQAQALQLKDEQLYRQLAPQHVTRDANGKVTGMDFDGLYTDMQSHGANVLPFQSKQIALQQQVLGLGKAQREQVDALHADIEDLTEQTKKAHEQESKNAPAAAATPLAPSATPGVENPLGPPVPGTGGMPAAMLPNMPAAQDLLKKAAAAPAPEVGSAPAGTPQSLGQPEPGAVPTSSESALHDSAANAQRLIGPKTQGTYQHGLLNLAAKWGLQAVKGLPSSLTDASQIDQAEAEHGSIREAMANADKAADIAQKSGAGAKSQAEAQAALWKEAGPGTLINIQTGQLIHGVAAPDVEEFRAYIARGGDPTQYSAWKAQQTAKATEGVDVDKAVRTEVGKQNALAPSLQQITNVTRAGRQYINREDIPQGSAGVTEQQALKSGIPVVDKDTASTLSDIDTAKANQDYMLNQIGSKLATDPSGRLYSAPANTIEKLAQTDPTLAAVGTYRNAAIQSLRAVAGSKGLRINQYEVQLAIDNDIPKMTDTLPVAQKKLQNLKAFLDNTEQSHLTRNRQQQPTQDFFSQFGGSARQQAQ